MIELKTLTNSELVESTFKTVKEERRITIEVLHHFRELERRKIFLEKGYPSLFAYIVKELGYSDSAAYRRIEAMRALKELPDIESKIESGSVNLTTLAKVQTYFKAEKKDGNVISKAQKTELLESLENRSTRDVEKVLLELRPQSLQEEKVRVVSCEHTELKLILSEELRGELDQIKNLLSHKYPNMNYTDLIGVLAKNALQRLDPNLKKREKPQKTKTTSNKNSSSETEEKSQPQNQRKATFSPEVSVHKNNYEKQSRYILSDVKHQVWKRDRGQCTFKDHKTGRVCGSKKFLEYDHVKPFALGGESTIENLRLLCRGHNQQRVSSLKVQTWHGSSLVKNMNSLRVRENWHFSGK
ncbi:MAG: HNH endonuclease [Pseudobdellovibrionaceae bacterium]